MEGRAVEALDGSVWCAGEPVPAMSLAELGSPTRPGCQRAATGAAPGACSTSLHALRSGSYARAQAVPDDGGRTRRRRRSGDSPRRRSPSGARNRSHRRCSGSRPSRFAATVAAAALQRTLQSWRVAAISDGEDHRDGPDHPGLTESLLKQLAGVFGVPTLVVYSSHMSVQWPRGRSPPGA
jgi:hypothetical protein